MVTPFVYVACSDICLKQYLQQCSEHISDISIDWMTTKNRISEDQELFWYLEMKVYKKLPTRSFFSFFFVCVCVFVCFFLCFFVVVVVVVVCLFVCLFLFCLFLLFFFFFFFFFLFFLTLASRISNIYVPEECFRTEG